MSRKRELPQSDLLRLEEKAFSSGVRRVAGVDEAGVGPLAGPVVAACVLVRDRDFSVRIDDSKKLTSRQRERAYLQIQQKCELGIGLASVEEIDRLNIFNASSLAMERAVRELTPPVEHILVDGRRRPLAVDCATEFITGGESASLSIACASIIAKVYRDTVMLQQHARYPEYGFDRHKGYGTRSHIANIREFGVCPLHRMSFRPCASNERVI